MIRPAEETITQPTFGLGALDPRACSRLRWRMNAAKSRNAAVGLDGDGNQDIAANVGRAPGKCQSARLGASAVEHEAEGDHRRRGNGAAVVGRWLITPMRHQVA